MSPEDHRSSLELLKEALENLESPERLEGHPWADSLMVREVQARHPELQGQPAGSCLVAMVAEAFRSQLPGEPPRRGKRLDARWGRAGILAARYFAPLLYRLPYPANLREAWGCIDPAIERFVFDGRGEPLEKERLRYRLVADEPEVAPHSTLSDWHRQGLEGLAAAIERGEKHLARQAGPGAALPGRKDRRRRLRLFSTLAAIALLLIALVLGGLKAQHVYEQALLVQQEARQLKQLARSDPDLESLRQAGPAVVKLRGDFAALEAELQPLLPLAGYLQWVPVYGGDLASAGEVLEMAGAMLQGAEQALEAMDPLLSSLEQDRSLDLPEALHMLSSARPGLEAALESTQRASRVRAGLDLDALSPRTRGLVEDYVDPVLPLMQDGLAAALALPDFMGATGSGPKTYLLLVQNPDELRPTGGFISAVGNLVVKDGEILALSFTDSGEVEDWDLPYPPAPWQLEQYMNSTVLLLRDASWFTDFPVAAQHAEYLNSYLAQHSVDGVIAFDYHALVMLLETLGPVQVTGHDEYVNAGNVVRYMRQAKSPPFGEPIPAGWTNKDFISDIGSAIMRRLYSTDAAEWQELVKSLQRILDQKHLLLQIDNPQLAEVIAHYEWNGSVMPGPGDFLMVVDSNVGFNKTNAVVDTALFYDVDLTDPSRPRGSLTAVNENHSPAMPACLHWDKVRPPGPEEYPIADCYWDYLRVYTPAGSALLDAAAQYIPGSWMILGEDVPARVDVLEEEIPGLQAFGTMMVVPADGSIQTMIQYSLPAGVLERDPTSGRVRYRLTVKKQPGTVAIPITIRIHLPAGSAVESLPPGALLQEDNLLLSTDLRLDLHLELLFTEE